MIVTGAVDLCPAVSPPLALMFTDNEAEIVENAIGDDCLPEASSLGASDLDNNLHTSKLGQ